MAVFNEIKIDTTTQAMLIGETGSGKSTLGKYICGYGESYYYTVFEHGEDKSVQSPSWDAVYLRQDPYKSFHPYISIASHFKDILKTKAEKRIKTFEEVLTLLKGLKIDQPKELLRRRINEISLGEAQRCALVMALIKESDFIVADEITAHVDQITANILLRFLKEFSDNKGFGYLIISHQPDQTFKYCREYYQIKYKEFQVFEPKRDSATHMLIDKPMVFNGEEGIEISNWFIDFDQHSHGSFSSGLKIQHLKIPVNQVWGIRGSSGSGKSSLVQALMDDRLNRFDTLFYKGESLNSFRELKEKLQIRYLPQSVVTVFNPRQSIDRSLKEIAWSHNVNEAVISKYLKAVALEDLLLFRRPDELSGGQIQRFGLISLLLSKPDLLILDESFSAMDTTTREKVWNFLKTIVVKRGMGVILISHDPIWLSKVSDIVFDLECESLRF
ncbi:ABC transporter ATP-binding protein [Membranihabitans marinus]